MRRQFPALALLSIAPAFSGVASADQAQTNCFRFTPQQIQCTTTSTPSAPPPALPVIKPVDIGAVMLQAEQIKALRAQREALEEQRTLQRQRSQLEEQRIQQAPLTDSEQRDVIRFRKFLDQLDECAHREDVSGCVDSMKSSDTDFAQIYAEQHAHGAIAYSGPVWQRAFNGDTATGSSPSTPTVGELYADLIKLDDLRKRGLLTDAEFNDQKKKLLEK